MTDRESAVGRRSVLATAGGVIATSGLSSVAAAGGPPPERGNGDDAPGRDGDTPGGGGPKNTCPEGTVLLAKYELAGGEFEYEKDSDYLEVGDAFEFTVTETKDGGEVLAFDFEDPTGVYDVHTVSVQTGEGVFRKETDDTHGSFDAREYDDSHPVQAVRNVLLCAKVWWQLDFARGEVPIPPDYGNSDADLVYAATGDGTDDSVTNPSLNRDGSSDFVDVPDKQFDITYEDGTPREASLTSSSA
jgi:hypothetical protein